MRYEMLIQVLAGGQIPMPQTAGAAGLDLHASEGVELLTVEEAGGPVQVKFGIAVAITPGFFGLVTGRSGWAKEGILAHTGIVDCDYRGEMSILLFNFSKKRRWVEAGERCGQLVIVKYEIPAIHRVDELPKTERGAGGFGSTGKK